MWDLSEKVDYRTVTGRVCVWKSVLTLLGVQEYKVLASLARDCDVLKGFSWGLTIILVEE